MVIWVVMLLYVFWLAFASRAANTASANAAEFYTPTATVTVTPTATPFPTSVAPQVSQISSNIPPPPVGTPPPLPAGVVLTLTPPPDSVGWTSSLDGKSHFADGKIHVGFFKGHVFHGAIQFDLSTIPPDSTIKYAALQLTGLSDQNLDLGGVWQVRLLESAADDGWLTISYDNLRQTSVQSTLQPALPREALGVDQTRQFVFNKEQLAALSQRLGSGRISFRIDGPSSGPNNLFTWQGSLPDTSQENGQNIVSGPVLKLVVEQLNYVVITSTPTPQNLLTVVAQAAGDITPTPLPAYWVTPIIVTSTPVPANAATATFQSQLATAEATVYGTATPLPQNLWTATPEPVLQAVPTPQGSLLPDSVPGVLIGKIAFLSDRAAAPGQNGQPSIYVMDADGGNIALLTDWNIYEAIITRDALAAGQEYAAFVENATQPDGGQQPAIYLYDYLNNRAEQMTRFETGYAQQPAWSPTQARIAFVANNSGTDEIWSINGDGTGLQQLTRDNPVALDGHPSWSPDGSQIVFWSNRSGQAQIWVMNADGSNARNLSQNNFDDWNPVWIKYSDFAIRPLPGGNFVPDPVGD